MSKRKFLIPLAVLGLLTSSLVACGGGKKTSKSADGSSGGQTESSQPAGDTSSAAGGNSSSNAPGTSSQQPGTSSQQPGTSSQQPGSSSQQPGTSSQQPGSSSQGGGSSQAAPEKSVNITECILMSEGGKAYVKVSGTQENYSTEDFVWAWGIKVNGDSGAFVAGKAQPEAADFQSLAFDANKAFTATYCLTDIDALQSGAFYRVYGGTPESYGDISFTTAETGARDATRSYYLRTDQNNSFVFDSVQPISFTKASVVNIPEGELPEGITNAGAYLKFGGVNDANITLEMLEEWHAANKIAGNFQRVIGGYSVHNHVDAERFWKIEGSDIFFYCYVGFVADGEGWMTHFDLVSGNAGANLQFDNVIWGEEEYVIGTASYRVYADSSKSGESNFYGCLGVKREKWIDPSIHVHAYSETPDKVNDATADYIKTEAYNCTGDCGTSVLRWNALDYDTTLSSSGLDRQSSYVRFASGAVENKNGVASTGSHIIYKVNVKAAQDNAGLAFKIKNTGGASGSAPVFKTIANDSSLGAIDNGDGTYTTATHRYGLKVNGVEYLLGDDDYGNKANVTDWFDWPVSFPLQAGVNTIDVFAYAGYRAQLMEFQLTGLPKYEESFEGYNVTFTAEHCKVYVYQGKDYATDPVEMYETKAMDEDGNIVPYDIEDELPQPQVNFKVVCDEGYSVTAPDNFTITGTYKNLKQNPAKSETPAVDDDTLFRITKVQTDLTVAIVAVEGESAPGKAATFEAENCSVKVYVGPKSDADRVEDAGPIFYGRDKNSPYDVVKTGGQINFVVTCNENYEFVPEIDADEKVTFIEGTYKAFKDDGEGCYRVTNIQSDLKITIAATKIGGGEEIETRVIDFSAKTVSHSAYNDIWTYGDATVSGGANNNGGWAFVKMGGKSATISAEDHPGTWIKTDVAVAYSVASVTMKFVGKCYNQESEKATVTVESYSDAALANKVAETPAQEVPAITTNEGVEILTFTFAAPQAANLYYKINFDIINTTTYNGVVALESITFDAAGAVAPVEIAQPHGNFSGYAVSAADDSNIFTNIALANEKAYVEVGSILKTTVDYTFDKATGLVTIDLGAYGVLTATYDEENNKLINCGIEGAAAAYLKNNNEIELASAENYWNLDGTTEELRNQFIRRWRASGASSWTVDNDESHTDRILSDTTNFVSGTGAMSMRPYSGSGNAVGLSLKNDFAEAKALKNIGFWVYNSSDTDIALRTWVFKSTGLTNAAEIGGLTAKANGWTYCRMGFNASIYNFNISNWNGSSNALVFDDIVLF